MANLSYVCTRRDQEDELDENRRYAVEESVSLIKENLEGSLCMLSEELEAFSIDPVIANGEKLHTVESLTDVTAKLIDASWKLVREHRSLMGKYDRLNDVHSKISNDNMNLKNRVERLRESLEKKDNALHQGLERERRLKTECQSVSRDLKHEREETLKLKKQMRSKDNQHDHEMRRAMQNGCKLREQLEKSMGTRPKRDAEKVARTESDDKAIAYKQTIRRLEENNRAMLEEIHELRDSLSLHSAGIDLHVEASGIWHDAET